MKFNFWEKFAMVCLVALCVFLYFIVQINRYQFTVSSGRPLYQIDRLTGEIKINGGRVFR